VAFDEADHDVGPALAPAVALVQHGEGLADPGRGTEVDAEVTRGLDDVGQRRRPSRRPARSLRDGLSETEVVPVVGSLMSPFLPSVAGPRVDRQVP
jgi:hypothetical protein